MIWPAVLALLVGCGVDERDARRVLDAYGFERVQIGDYAWTGCGREDWFGSEFSAVNANKRSVNGVVCCGVTKNCTVRLR